MTGRSVPVTIYHNPACAGAARLPLAKRDGCGAILAVRA